MKSIPVGRTEFKLSYAQTLLSISLILMLLLGVSWFGLNVIRVRTYNYAADYQRHLGDFRQGLYWDVVASQGFLVLAAKLDAIVSLGLTITLIIQKLRSLSA